jgi:hypothetical protein
MNKEGVILIMEDDLNDPSVFEEVFNELGYSNKRIYFPDGQVALDYLYSSGVSPFIILSDIIFQN